ncbi:pyridoxal 5'-phosphate synthase glutaminase subunit PdxT [Methanorbis furvi]|uniref:Pyridoxal 5'-phosphate synthase subunit PdxT n=1 Tax=Methanorbis furvi TaxID=3028299 RepID=A0AAE4MAN5_9EURY|nr:Pyridoxal 5'-phosphate synthase subunit PdxT [Methanocorpusculaceae archaeon Ag1]
MRIGVLALQGAFAEHICMLGSLGVEAVEIRKRSDLNQPLDGLIIPGGESTTITKLLHDLGIFSDLREKISAGLPVMGTCAGLIVLAKRVEGGVPCLATMDITAVRNAYGRQLGSFETVSRFADVGDVPMTFIRAPCVEGPGADVEILSVVDGRIVAVREKNQLALAFHPELDCDTRVHAYFLNMIDGK